MKRIESFKCVNQNFYIKILFLEVILKLPSIMDNIITKNILTKYGLIICIYKDIEF